MIEYVNSNDDYINVTEKDLLLLNKSYLEEKLKFLEDKLDYTLTQQSLLADISQKLNSFYNIENKIKETIELLGEHTNVSRVYIFEDDDENETTSNTYEWCNIGILPQKELLQNIEIKNISVWYQMLRKEGRIFSTNIKELPYEVFQILEPQGIKSILIFPLQEQKLFFGFIGFDECNLNRDWEKDEIELLRTISNIVSSTFSRIKIQKELIESESQLKMINLTRDKFFSIISHDLRTYIGNLMQIAEMIFEKNELNNKIPKNLIESQRNISKNTYYLLENLLNWSKSNIDKLDFFPEMLIINDIINDVIENYKFQLLKKNITLSFECSEQFKVYGDDNMVQLILRNLLSNAIKYTKKNGQIEIFLSEESKLISIKIIDTGVGISKDNLDKILSDNSFFTTYGTENEKGTGLGLKLCRNFINLNKGTLKIDSKLHKGSAFSFTLPIFKEL